MERGSSQIIVRILRKMVYIINYLLGVREDWGSKCRKLGA